MTKIYKRVRVLCGTVCRNGRHDGNKISRREFGTITTGIAGAVFDARNGVMAMSANIERFKAIVERGFSRGDLTVADEICDTKLIEHQYLTRTDLSGPQILKAQIEDARHSIKDLKFTVESHC